MRFALPPYTVCLEKIMGRPGAVRIGVRGMPLWPLSKYWILISDLAQRDACATGLFRVLDSNTGS